MSGGSDGCYLGWGLQALGKQLQGLASCKVDDDEDAGSGHMTRDSNAGFHDDLFKVVKAVVIRRETGQIPVMMSQEGVGCLAARRYSNINIRIKRKNNLIRRFY